MSLRGVRSSHEKRRGHISRHLPGTHDQRATAANLLRISGAGPGHDRVLLVREIFADAYNYMKSGTLMRQIINGLNQDIDLNDSKKRHALVRAV